MVEHRSVSQHSTYNDCPYSYYLRYIYRDKDGNRAWRRPAAWLVQGTAFHTVAEQKSKKNLTEEQALDLFRQQYSEDTSALTADTPRFEDWFASGPYRGPEDLERRWKLGQEQVSKLYRWKENHPEEKLWRGMVEHEFTIDLDGVIVKGFIDEVYEVDGDVRPRDYKTGNKPGKPFQIATYKVVVEAENPDVEVRHGDFWMGKTGKPTMLIDLTEWTREEVTNEFHELDRNIRAERFDPDPEPSKCRFCSVNSSCEFRA